jgi:hypothetical protein
MLWEEQEESEDSTEESDLDISPQDKHLTKNLDELTMDDKSEPGNEGNEAEGPGPARALLEELRHALPLEIVDEPRNALDNAFDLLCNRPML